MTGKGLLSNLNTWDLIVFLEEKKQDHGLDREVLRNAMQIMDSFIE